MSPLVPDSTLPDGGPSPYRVRARAHHGGAGSWLPRVDVSWLDGEQTRQVVFLAFAVGFGSSREARRYAGHLSRRCVDAAGFEAEPARGPALPHSDVGA
jgi:hypothetical protein